MKEIPKSVLAQHLVVLGKTGSGKSYAVRGIVEGLLDESARVCIIDPTGAWNGLRSSASGKSAGYPVVIFGGAHADLPLSVQHGEAIAETIGTSSTPAIIDTSLMRVGERTRFAAEFADALIRKNKGPLHLVIDEAHLFAPQGKVNSPVAGEMLSAFNNLVSLGRSRGLRIILITQRPAKLHKDSLTQCETLIALRLIAPQDRNAVREWIDDNADKAKGQEIISSLATLKTGHGWIWAPELGILESIAFPKIRTFDSGRAPDGSEGKSQVLAPIDIDAINQKLKAVKADALANDPAELKKRIRELERQASIQQPAPAPDPAAAEKAYNAGYDAGQAAGWNAARSHISEFGTALQTWLGGAPALPAMKLMEQPTITRSAVQAGFKQLAGVIAGSSSMTSRAHAPRPARVPSGSNGRSTSLPPGESKVLSALIQFPEGLRREQLTVLTTFARSTRDKYLQLLASKGLVEASGDRMVATAAGVDALPDVEPLPRGPELQRYWFERLPPGESKILRLLVEMYPQYVDRDLISESTSFARSTRDKYLQLMQSKQIVETNRGGAKASADLFL